MTVDTLCDVGRRGLSVHHQVRLKASESVAVVVAIDIGYSVPITRVIGCLLDYV